MKTRLKSYVVSAVCFASLTVAHNTLAVEAVTPADVKRVWEAEYKRTTNKWYPLASLAKQVAEYRAVTNPDGPVTEAENAILDRIWALKHGTIDETDEKIWRDLRGVRICLQEIAEWQLLRQDTNILMRIADKLGGYNTLPVIPRSALGLAHTIDTYVEYGTNQPPRNVGGLVSGSQAWRPWFGPVGSRVGKLIDFREGYNYSVRSMRGHLLMYYYYVLSEARYGAETPHPAEENMALWKEFARRAKATEAEIALAESRTLPY